MTALVLYNQQKEYYPKLYSDTPHGYVGLVGRVTYDWKSRYMAEFNVGYNGDVYKRQLISFIPFCITCHAITGIIQTIGK